MYVCTHTTFVLPVYISPAVWLLMRSNKQRNTHDGATQYDFHEARRQVIRRCHVGESASDLVETNRTEADRIVHDAFFDRNTDSLKERLARVKALQCQINVYGTQTLIRTHTHTRDCMRRMKHEMMTKATLSPRHLHHSTSGQ